MGKIKNTDELRMAILDLELRNDIHKQTIRRKVKDIAENLNPVNILKKTVGNLVRSPGLGGNLLNIAAGAGAAFFMRKILKRKVENKGRHLLIDLVQLGVSSFLAARARKRNMQFDHKK